MNDVRWSPTGDAIASASDDSTIRLFDLRNGDSKNWSALNENFLGKVIFLIQN